VILDGVADEPCQALGQITPLQAAKTPNLDAIAKDSKLDYCYTVKKDFVPESNEAVISLLGYDYLDVSRGVLEAHGLGINLKNGDLALRCNFATIDDLENRNVLDRRAGRNLSTKEARELAKAINEKVKLPFKFEFYPSIQHRGVLVIRGGFSDNVSDVDAVNEKLRFSKALDDVDDSQLSADLINRFVRESHRILDVHPINVARAKKGLYSANVILCRGAGSNTPKLKKMKGKWMALGYMPLEIGVARVSKMELYKFRYPKLKKIDAYANLYDGLRLAVKYAIRMLKWNRKKYDYFYIHIKETDLPGHDNKPYDKIKMIEYIDKYFFKFLKKFLDRDKAKLVLTADHTTACRLKAHSADPVPVLSYPDPSGEKREKRFTEEEGLKGKRIIGKKLLAERMFNRM